MEAPQVLVGQRGDKMTIEEAITKVREHLKHEYSNGAQGLFQFRVNAAARDTRGLIVVWCSHACPLVWQHHRAALDGDSGEFIAIQRRPTAEVEPGNGL